MSDGPLPPQLDRPSGWGYYENPGPSGATPAFWRMLDFFERFAAADRLITFEDDIEPCRSLVRMMLAVKLPDDCSLFTGYRSICNRFHERPEGLFTESLRGGLHGSLAWLIHGDSVHYLLRSPSIRQLNNCDLIASELLSGSPRPNVLVSTLSLVEHRGSVSVCGEHRAIKTFNWRGADFDAMTLADKIVR